MSKTKIALVIYSLVLTFSLLGTLSLTNPIIAAPEAAQWSGVNTPTEGRLGNWVLAADSDIKAATIAIDGTIYAYANPSSGYTLFKSTDGGYNWSTPGRVTDTIVALTTAPDDAKVIYYATAGNLYKSTNAGDNFTLWAISPGGAGTNNIAITSIDVVKQENNYIVAIGTKDSDSGQFGGIYIIDENQPFAGPTNTGLGNFDVYTMAFSPNFSSDRQLIAVVSDEHDTFIKSKLTDTDWSSIIADGTIVALTPRTATLAFPDGYNINNYASLFLGLDTGAGNGDVYRIDFDRTPSTSMATDLDISSGYGIPKVDISGLAVSGDASNAFMIAGAAGSNQIYTSPDGGDNWKKSTKFPTGQSGTLVYLAPDFKTSHIAYAATSGTESAFSISDNGSIWNQTGLIDTTLTAIVDISPSPDYSHDNTIFMITFDGSYAGHSLWRTADGGTKWNRVNTNTMANIDELNMVEVSRKYETNQTLFVAGKKGSSSVILRSIDKGQTFINVPLPFTIDAWALSRDDFMFLASYNSTGAAIYRTGNYGLTYYGATDVGTQPVRSIALSPNYEQDKAVLVGNTSGWVYFSSDAGENFSPLPVNATSQPLSGGISVGFDPNYTFNKTVYASCYAVGKGVYRFTVNKSTAWESIDGTLPTGAIMSWMALSPDGIMYVSDSKVNTGMERSLNPNTSSGATFETVTKGLSDGAVMSGLWLQGKQLWSIDTHNYSLMTYNDTLSQPVILVSPANSSAGVGNSGVRLDWETLDGATEYKWQLDYDDNFANVPAEFTANTSASFVRLPALDGGTTYYWRVRAIKPVLSPWSDKWSFTTTLGTTLVAPELLSPQAGAIGMDIKPVFQWSAFAGADKYELLISKSNTFSDNVVAKTGDDAVPATAWQTDITLDYNTTYYWKVRASGSNSFSAWSAVGAFTTKEQPAAAPSTQPTTSIPTTPTAPTAPTQPATSSPSTPVAPPSPSTTPIQSGLPQWSLYLMIGMGVVVVLLVATMLVQALRA